MSSKRRHEGYFQVDHSVSPGLPDELMPPGLPPGSGRVNFEAPAVTCNHCQNVIVLNPKRDRDRAYCRYCDHFICDNCGGILKATGKCLPYRDFLDEVDEWTVTGKSRILTNEGPRNGKEIIVSTNANTDGVR